MGERGRDGWGEEEAASWPAQRPQEPRPPLQLPSGCGHSGDLGRLAGRPARSPEGARTALGWVPGGAHPPGGLAPRPLAWGLCPAPRTGSSDESVCLKCSPCIFPGTQRRGFLEGGGGAAPPWHLGHRRTPPHFRADPRGIVNSWGSSLRSPFTEPQEPVQAWPGQPGGVPWLRAQTPDAYGRAGPLQAGLLALAPTPTAPARGPWAWPRTVCPLLGTWRTDTVLPVSGHRWTQHTPCALSSPPGHLPQQPPNTRQGCPLCLEPPVLGQVWKTGGVGPPPWAGRASGAAAVHLGSLSRTRPPAQEGLAGAQLWAGPWAGPWGLLGRGGCSLLSRGLRLLLPLAASGLGAHLVVHLLGAVEDVHHGA